MKLLMRLLVGAAIGFFPASLVAVSVSLTSHYRPEQIRLINLIMGTYMLLCGIVFLVVGFGLAFRFFRANWKGSHAQTFLSKVKDH